MTTLYSPVGATALYQRLTTLGRPDLLAKVTELRSRVDIYLRGVSSTFIHYTSHAVDHGDQIVRELSSLLFNDVTKQTSISVDLNATECYFLLLCAYLHDVGMVVTDDEKYAALASESWTDFVNSNVHIQADYHLLERKLESGRSPTSTAEQLFLAGLEQRLFLAEHFRRQHAARAAGAINGALNVLPDFLGDDPAAGRTITAICVGHGLNRAEIATDISYPTRRDLFGEPVNVRLLTMLLRLGDLLDMRFDRACPLLNSLASPLPQSSEVHWSQYGCITSRITSPAVIGIRAECTNVSEYRLLRDWCTWLADEVRDAPRILAGALHHKDWQPPRATIGVDAATIQVTRAAGATYRTEDWRFTLDEPEVFSRLVNDVHSADKYGYMKELIQNSLDSIRARAYLDSGSSQPYPNLLPLAVREAYAVNVELTVSDSKVTTVVVSDSGTGMTIDTIQNYFLQVGRSWYRSKEFLGRWNFNPTSQFGVGFLSVFAVSEDVSVLTRWHESRSDESILMNLPGPRNYLLFEDANRSHAGTSVTVQLRQPVELEDVRQYLINLCSANEFPILLVVKSESGEITRGVLPVPTAEPDAVIPLGDDSSCRIRTIDLTADGVFGRFQFLVIASPESEDWSVHGGGLAKLLGEMQPLAELPTLSTPTVSINGLRAHGRRHVFTDTESWSVDMRKADASRTAGLDRSLSMLVAPAYLDEDLGRAIEQHLSDRKSDLQYRTRLTWRFEGFAPKWADNSEVLADTGGRVQSTLDVLSQDVVRIAILVKESYESHPPYANRLQQFVNDSGLGSTLLPFNGVVSIARRRRIMDQYDPTLIHHVFERLFVVEFTRRLNGTHPPQEMCLVPFSRRSDILKLELPNDSVVLNRDHPLLLEVLRLSREHPIISNKIISELKKKHFHETNLSGVLAAAAAELHNDILRSAGARLTAARDRAGSLDRLLFSIPS